MFVTGQRVGRRYGAASGRGRCRFQWMAVTVLSRWSWPRGRCGHRPTVAAVAVAVAADGVRAVRVVPWSRLGVTPLFLQSPDNRDPEQGRPRVRLGTPTGRDQHHDRFPPRSLCRAPAVNCGVSHRWYGRILTQRPTCFTTFETTAGTGWAPRGMAYRSRRAVRPDPEPTPL
jgi:hypothetical protein